MSEWISVKSRLPKLDETVIVCRRKFNGDPIIQFGARIFEDEGWLWGVGGAFGVERGDSPFQNDIEADDEYDVTHWMPLPRTPFRKKTSKTA